MAKEGVPLTQHKATHLSWSVSHPLGYLSLAGLCCRVEHTQDTQYLSLPSSLPVSLLYSLSSRRYVCVSLGHLTGALEFIVQKGSQTHHGPRVRSVGRAYFIPMVCAGQRGY